MEPQWLDWARRLQALAQSGITYTTNAYDIERYEAVQEIAAEMVAARTGSQPDQVLSLWSGEHGYATPKIDVRGVVFRDGEMLLVRERSDGGWTLPGGWADVGESPSEAVEKEVYEESGYRVRAAKLLAVWDRSRHPHPPSLMYMYKLFIRCDLVGGSARDSLETSDAGFFDESCIPQLSVARVTPGQIARMFERCRHPELPADFD